MRHSQYLALTAAIDALADRLEREDIAITQVEFERLSADVARHLPANVVQRMPQTTPIATTTPRPSRFALTFRTPTWTATDGATSTAANTATVDMRLVAARDIVAMGTSEPVRAKGIGGVP